MGSRRDVEMLARKDETVLRAADSRQGRDTGVLVLTDKRVFFVSFGEIRWAIKRDALNEARWQPDDDSGELILRAQHASFEVHGLSTPDGHAIANAISKP